MEDADMNESEWLFCTKPDLMLAYLQQRFGSRTLTRKIRLFICACRRLGWDLSAAPEERVAIETAERFADGQVSHAERDAARWKLMPDYQRYRLSRVALIRAPLQIRQPSASQMLAILACEPDRRMRGKVSQAVTHLVLAWTEAALGPNAHQRPGSEWKQYQTKHRAAVSYYLRDIFGNPFRTISVDSSCVEWNDRIVPRLAQTIYDEYAFDRMPILADALEEAGCTDADLLNHCRQPGEHLRGCWAIDLLLGKN